MNDDPAGICFGSCQPTYFVLARSSMVILMIGQIHLAKKVSSACRRRSVCS